MSKAEGLKYDEGKVRLDLIDPNFINGVGEVLTMGANKYGADNWQGLDDFEDRYYAAALRHLLAWRNGESIDKESGLHHLKHVATNIMFLLWKGEKNEKI